MTLKYVLACSLVVAASLTPSIVMAKAAKQDPVAPVAQPGAKQSTPPAANDGGRVFEQNCSRCHATPEGFSPRISATVVRHMRVRAALSSGDERALLQFLNP